MAQHKQEIEFFLNIQKNDILLISEAHLSSKDYFNIYKYKTYYIQRLNGRARGGTALIIGDKIPHVERDKHEVPHIQATTIKVKLSIGPLIIATVYCLPRHL